MSLGANNGGGGGWVAGNLVPSPTATRSVLVDANSKIEVTFQDVSLMDVPSTEIGKQTIKVTRDRNFPIAFRVGYDPKKVSDAATFVITKDNPTKDVKVVLQDMGGRPSK
ncbi:hypothetical protein BGZ82_003487 [Podila clonocystis]|nr:hypothetical protein BGZ82_003487 [Podila clonocystis]